MSGTSRLNIRVPRDLLTYAVAQAYKNGMSVTEWVRACIERERRRSYPEPKCAGERAETKPNPNPDLSR